MYLTASVITSLEKTDLKMEQYRAKQILKKYKPKYTLALISPLRAILYIGFSMLSP